MPQGATRRTMQASSKGRNVADGRRKATGVFNSDV